MKQPKTFLLLSVIVAVLVLGVAYAAIQNITLTVSGNVTSTPESGNFNVQFVSGTGKKVSGAGQGTFTAVAQDGKYLSATLDVSGMNTKGQTATYEIEIKNASEGGLGANLKLSTLTPTVTDAAGTTAPASEYFSVQATLGADSIASGATTKLTVVITMTKTPIDTIEGAFTFNVTAEPFNS